MNEVVILKQELSALRSMLDWAISDIGNIIDYGNACEYCAYNRCETVEHDSHGGCHACRNHGGLVDCFKWRGINISDETKMEMET